MIDARYPVLVTIIFFSNVEFLTVNFAFFIYSLCKPPGNEYDEDSGDFEEEQSYLLNYNLANLSKL